MEGIILAQLLGEGQDPFQVIMQIVWIATIFIFMLYGQRIQLYLSLGRVAKSLEWMRKTKNYSRKETINTIENLGCEHELALRSLNKIVNSFVIFPQDMDPAGIVPKLEHILDVREAKWLAEIKKILPNIDDATARNVENLTEIATILEKIYKIVRHFYLLGKKTKNFYLIIQLEMILPQLMEVIKAFLGGIYAFENGLPIGDGIGPFVAAKMAEGKFTQKIAKDTVMAEIDIEGRRTFVIKPFGPGGNIAKWGDAIKEICKKIKNVRLIVTIDAALKLEGEKTAEVAEGIGVAIGGLGVEKFKIEEEATRHGIPVQAVIIKQSIKEAISVMSKKVYDSVNEVMEKIKEIITENTEKGEVVIVAGIGNTIGIGQG